MKSQALRVILFFLLCELNLQHTAARGLKFVALITSLLINLLQFTNFEF